MALEPGSTLVTSADQHLNGKVGTIELWVKLRAPRQDNVSDCFVGVIGGDGMYFGKFIFGQIAFGFNTNFARQCGFECWPNQVTNWAPGAWRHFVAVWDKDVIEVFIDGKLTGYQAKPNLTKYPGDCLSIGGSNWGVDLGSFDFDDVRISDVVRYRFPVPEPKATAK
jgi:hypothetical protein